MSGRRRSRHGGAPRKPIGQAARSSAQTTARVRAAGDGLAELGVAYGRLLAAARKTLKRGEATRLHQQITEVTTRLNTTAEQLETRLRR